MSERDASDTSDASDIRRERLPDNRRAGESQVRDLALVTDYIKHMVQAIAQSQRDALAGVQLELRAVVNDNAHLRDNLARLNTQMGEFAEKIVVPLREELKEIQHTGHGRAEDNARNLEVLIAKLSQAAGDLVHGEHIDAILRGRFEDGEHRVANESSGDEIHGYIRAEAVQVMIDAAVEKAIAQERAK